RKIPGSVSAPASLCVQGHIIQENEPQLDKRTAEGRGQGLKGSRGPNGGHRRAIQRLFAGTSDHRRFRIGNNTVAHDAKLQDNFSPITQARRFRHHRIPVALHAGQDSSNVVGKVDSFGGRKDLHVPAQIALPSATSTAANSSAARCWPRTDWTSELSARGSAVFNRFV